MTHGQYNQGKRLVPLCVLVIFFLSSTLPAWPSPDENVEVDEDYIQSVVESATTA